MFPADETGPEGAGGGGAARGAQRTAAAVSAKGCWAAAPASWVRGSNRRPLPKRRPSQGCETPRWEHVGRPGPCLLLPLQPPISTCFLVTDRPGRLTGLLGPLCAEQTPGPLPPQAPTVSRDGDPSFLQQPQSGGSSWTPVPFSHPLSQSISWPRGLYHQNRSGNHHFPPETRQPPLVVGVPAPYAVDGRVRDPSLLSCPRLFPPRCPSSTRRGLKTH